MSFDFYGNKRAVSLLQKAIASDKIAHAYLFSGEMGLGKKTLARQFAKGILCSGKEAPCGSCASCLKIDKGCHPDYTELGPAQGKDSFPVDAVRELIKNAYIRPNESERRVFLVNRAETMSASAANALLKLFEEPPKGVVLLLTCSNRMGLLKTISSRCIPIELYPVSKKECSQALQRYCAQTDRSLLDNAEILAGGNIGRAIYYASDKEGISAVSISGKLELALAQKNKLAFIQAAAPLEKDVHLFLAVLLALNERIRNALTERFKNKEPMSPIGKNYSVSAIIKMARSIEEVMQLLSLHSNVKLTLCRLAVDLLN